MEPSATGGRWVYSSMSASTARYDVFLITDTHNLTMLALATF